MEVLHVAAIDLESNSGMGRIGFEWKKAFEKQGHTVIHIGKKEIAKLVHPLLFGWEVRKEIKARKLCPDIILAHEPVAGFLKFNNIPLVVYSHGVEERDWQKRNQYKYANTSFKSGLIPRTVRFFSNNRGFKKASTILLSNTEDKEYLTMKGIQSDKLTVFKNGYYPYEIERQNRNEISFLFNATWIARKGTVVIAKAFNEILSKHQDVRLVLAGTKCPDEVVYAQFSDKVKANVLNIPSFDADQEQHFYSKAQVFVMPSFFEGQSLALTQAMAMGLCPVVSNNCGQIDFVKHKCNGLVFETGSYQELLQNIEWLLKNRTVIAEYGDQARETVKKLLWASVSHDVVKVCEQAVAKEKQE